MEQNQQNIFSSPNIMPPQRRVSIYDPKMEKMVSVAPFGKRAKMLYLHYIRDLGHSPTDILPPGLSYEPSARVPIKPLKMPPPRISERTAYKTFLQSYTLHNDKPVRGLAGFGLLREMTQHLIIALKVHGGIKFHVSAT